MEERIKLNRLVESWACGFGRIVEVSDFSFTVKYPYPVLPTLDGPVDEMIYDKKKNNLKFWDDAETNYYKGA